MSEAMHTNAGGGSSRDATRTDEAAGSRGGASPRPPIPSRLLQAFLWLATVMMVFYLLVIGQALIIPLVLAFFAWYLINTLNKLTRSIRIRDWRPPRWLAFTLSALVVVGVLIGLAMLILDNVNKVQRKAPEYRQRISEINQNMRTWLPEDVSESVRQMIHGPEAASPDEPPLPGTEPDDDASPSQREGDAEGLGLLPITGDEGIPASVTPGDASSASADSDASREDAAAAVARSPGTDETPRAAAAPPRGEFSERLRYIDFTGVLQAMAATLGSFAGSAVLVLAYLFFIFLEQRFFDAKLRMLIKDDKRRRDVQGIIAEIDRDIRSYIGVKTLVSALTAGLSYIIMKSAGLDFAEFWAVLLFVFNYIPNIGSLIATALPAALALIQLDLTWFLVVAIGITAVQLAMANLVEPNLMGKSLNQSPLVVILSLVLWGTLWGVAGMFLCVPITVVVMIVLSHFPQTRWVPVMLSLDGRVRGDPEVRRVEQSHSHACGCAGRHRSRHPGGVAASPPLPLP